MTPIYATADQLRALPGMGALTDDEANDLLERAEDIADAMLGAWSVDDTTGRKIVEADVEAWQWSKLSRFVCRTAARLQSDPAATAQQWQSVRGPDFAFSGPAAAGWEQRLGAELVGLLNGTGLRRLGGRVAPRRSLASSELDAVWWGEDEDC